MAKDRPEEKESKAQEAVEDIIDVATAKGDEDTPTSDSDAPAPG
jgi:hypothetical protein